MSRWPAYEDAPPEQITHPLMMDVLRKHEQVIELTEDVRRYRRELAEQDRRYSRDAVEHIIDLVERRLLARLAKDFASADSLRQELASLGIQPKDRSLSVVKSK